ncbi:ABC transporter substrate-binding protein [Psychrobacillus sp. FSL H8-0483]|uniref:ABC transporter substrate-binding protein n=1 Tax=Psychrobacillus sp. FSL H8-0483 TaxID=2921389 RepID=UPI003159AA7A
MDKHLLTLWNAVPSGNIKQDKLAEVLDLSLKQTTRYIQKWSAEGWLMFTSGRGRGNVSKLEWLKDVEAIFEEQVMQTIEEETVEVSSKYLLFDWSIDSKLRLMNKFRTKFGYVQNTNDKLVVPRKYPFLTMHPLYAADVSSAKIVATIYNRLVAVDEEGIVSPELAHSWDMTETKLRLYLKKDIRFHDGSVLTAEDVVICLDRLRHDRQFQTLWQPIERMEVVAPLIVDINFPSGCSYCLQMLGTMNTSIYKEKNEALIGTGSFFIEENNETKTTLVAFKDYYGERPLLDKIEFVQVPEEFDIVYRSSTEDSGKSFFPVESDSGFGVVIMNASQHTSIQRKEVRDYIHFVISKYRHEISEVDPHILPNSQGCLIGQSKSYHVKEVTRPNIEKPLVLKEVNYTKNTTFWLKDVLEKEGVPIETKWVSFADNISNRAENSCVDLFIHGEVFEMNQNFSFFHFLMNGYSPLAEILRNDEKYRSYLAEYARTPFEEWTSLNVRVEQALIEDSIIIPLYYAKRHIPFSADLMNINIKHFGHVDFSKLWVRPEIK